MIAACLLSYLFGLWCAVISIELADYFERREARKFDQLMNGFSEKGKRNG